MKCYVFGPLASQELYVFEPYYGQPLDSPVYTNYHTIVVFIL